MYIYISYILFYICTYSHPSSLPITVIASWSLDVSPWRVPLHLVAWHQWDSKSKCCHPEMTMDGWIRSWIWFWSWTWFCIVVLLTICILCLQSSCDKNDYAYWIHCFGIVFLHLFPVAMFKKVKVIWQSIVVSVTIHFVTSNKLGTCLRFLTDCLPPKNKIL